MKRQSVQDFIPFSGYFDLLVCLIDPSFQGIITFLVTLYFMKYGSSIGAGILAFTYLILILLFYLVLWLTPEGKLFRRDALRSYARFWSIYRLLSLISSILLVTTSSHNIGDCFYFFGPTLFYILCKPYTIYWALLADSIWWQGVYATRPMGGASGLLHRRRQKGEYAINKQNLVSPLFGIEVAFNDAQELGRQVWNLALQALRCLGGCDAIRGKSKASQLCLLIA